MKARQRGWSLVELAVVLLVLALLSVTVVRIVPVTRQVAEGDRVQRDMTLAEEALLGHARARNRLPMADADGDGKEDAGAQTGWLPVRTLGLPSSLRLKYQLASALSATPSNRFQPAYPPATGAPTAPVNINGLDYCWLLARQQGAPASPMPGLGMPAAFALAHPGPAGHDHDSAQPFVLPGSDQPGAKPHMVRAVGIGELSARLACPDRVARVQGAARAALVAYDLRRIAGEYERFRDFDVDTAELTLSNAEVGVLFGSLDIAFAVVDEVLAIAQIAAGWPPDAAAIAIGVAEQIVAATAFAAATANLALAAMDLESAKEGLVAAKDNLTAAKAHLERMKALETSTRARLAELDSAGLST